MHVTIHKLKDARFSDYHSGAAGGWNYADLVDGSHPNWFHDWISFDCLLIDEPQQTVWCGLTSLDSDIAYAFDRKRGEFRSLQYPHVGNRYDAKFHRSLLFDRAGKIWAATAMLHDVDRYFDAPGGALVEIDPETGSVRVVCRPLPHVYIQSIAYDAILNVLYGATFTPERLFCYHLADGRVVDLGPLGSGMALAQGENLVIDRQGTCWGAWGVTRAWAYERGPDEFRLWRYNPDRGRIEFLPQGLPRLEGAGTAHLDGACLGPEGAIYLGSKEGLLCRVEPESGAVTVLGKPAPGRRLAALAVGPDERLYGCVGSEGHTSLFSYDPRRDRLCDLGQIVASDSGEAAWQMHCLAIAADGTLFAGENDVPHRSGYLWEIRGAC